MFIQDTTYSFIGIHSVLENISETFPCPTFSESQCIYTTIWQHWQTTYELNGNHKNSFERELATAQIKQIFETLSQQLQNERIVAAARTKVEHLRNAVLKP